MSTTATRPTLKSTNARIDTLGHKLDAILAHLTGDEPAKPVTRTRKASTKAPAKKAPAKKGTTAKRVRTAPKKGETIFVTKHSLQAVKRAALKENVDFTGYSTKDVAEFCVTHNWAPKGFKVGPRYTEMFSA